jgi:succinate-semialdehyde dehydrogenase/glutarate-semialdehyde dehydrogenase
MSSSPAHWIDGARRGAGRAGASEHAPAFRAASPRLLLPCAGREEWAAALEAAERSLRALAFAPPSVQAPSFARLELALAARTDELVAALVEDLGWTEAEAADEVAAGLVEFSSGLRGESRHLASSSPLGGRRPGLLVAAPPSDAPLLPILRALGAALWAGNALVAAAPPAAPRAFLALVDALEESDLHAGTVQVLFGRATALAEALAAPLAHLRYEDWSRIVPLDDAAGDSRSADESHARLGEDRMATAAVFGPEGDLEHDAARYAEALLARGGASAEAPRALFVHEDRASELGDALVAELARAPAPPARAPLVEDGAIRAAEYFVKRALGEGVAIPIGGQADARSERRPSAWFEPTLLVNVPRASLTARARTRAPIAVLIRYASLGDLLVRAELSRHARFWIHEELAGELRELGAAEMPHHRAGLGTPEPREGEGLFDLEELRAAIEDASA